MERRGGGKVVAELDGQQPRLAGASNSSPNVKAFIKGAWPPHQGEGARRCPDRETQPAGSSDTLDERRTFLPSSLPSGICLRGEPTCEIHAARSSVTLTLFLAGGFTPEEEVPADPILVFLLLVKAIADDYH